MAAAINEPLGLEDLIQRATDPSSEATDELAMNLFCSLVREEPALIKKSTELIVSKIKSTNVIQSRKAIELLEECMSKCGSEFQMTIARFQFLNELIRLVSTKFSGDDTHPQIRNKILDCLSLWTVQYPERTKIKEAYETLLRSGVQHEVTPTISTSVRRTDFIDVENEKLLKKLLKSNNREDLQRANLLIQYLVKQDTKKSELASRQRLELQEARNSAMLLSQIIERWAQDEVVEDEEIAKEIYNLCQKSKSIVVRMPEIIEDSEELLADAIEVNDFLGETMAKYNQMQSKDFLKKSSGQTRTDSPVLFASTGDTNAASTNLLDELTDIFSQNVNPTLTSNASLLEPVALRNVEDHAPHSNDDTNPDASKSTINGNSSLSTIDSLSEDLFKHSFAISERKGTFKKISSKTPMKDLISMNSKDSNTKDVASPNYENHNTIKGADEKCISLEAANTVGSIIDNSIDTINVGADNLDPLLACLGQSGSAEVFDMETTSQAVSQLSDPLLANLLELNSYPSDVKSQNPPKFDTTAVLLDDEEIAKIDEILTIAQDNVIPAKEDKPSNETVKHLSEINVELNSIQPSGERPRIIMDDLQGLRVTLNFALDRPSRHVSVIVISTINQSASPIDKYQFEASVKKPCKLRLLPPTGNLLPGVKPFRPPTEDIQQVLLLFNPTQVSVDLTCIIGYQQGDDPDPIKESVVVKDIPYCE